MKIALFLILWLISFSCQNNADISNEKVEVQLNDVMKSEKSKIQLDGIDDHPNKETMEWLLNNYKEEFIASEVEWKTLEHEDLMQKGYNFHTKSSDIYLMLIFCKHQDDALMIADANFPVVDEVQIAGVNGGVLFVVEGEDPYKVNDVLAWFSGEE